MSFVPGCLVFYSKGNTILIRTGASLLPLPATNTHHHSGTSDAQLLDNDYAGLLGEFPRDVWRCRAGGTVPEVEKVDVNETIHDQTL